MLYFIISAILPALILVYFIWVKDKYQKEPTPQLLRAFGLGVLAAPFSMLFSLPAMATGLFGQEMETVADSFRVAFFGAAIPEELAKFLLLWHFLKRCKYYDEYVDGIVYAVCVGMGFAAIENVGYIFDVSTLGLGAWVSTVAARALISVPGHFLMAVAMGYFYSRYAFGPYEERRLNFTLALIVPILLHGLFDFFLMASSVVIYGSGALLLLFGGLYVFMVARGRRNYERLLAYDESRLDASRLPEPDEQDEIA